MLDLPEGGFFCGEFVDDITNAERVEAVAQAALEGRAAAAAQPTPTPPLCEERRRLSRQVQPVDRFEPSANWSEYELQRVWSWHNPTRHESYGRREASVSQSSLDAGGVHPARTRGSYLTFRTSEES